MNCKLSSGITAQSLRYVYRRCYVLIYMEYIHFWDLPPNTGIKFDAEYRKMFFSRAIEYFGGSNKVGVFLRKGKSLYNNDTKFKGSLIRHIKCATHGSKFEYCRVWVIAKLAKKMNLPLGDLEKHIVGYRGPIGYKVSVEFPIKVTPEFTALLAHMMGDGTDKRTRMGVGSYTQYNPIGLVNFCKKMENVFGKLESNPIFEDDDNVYVPKLFLLVIKQYFNINGFGTHESFVPPKIFGMSRSHRLAFITAFLVDEGALYDTICFRVANPKLASGVRDVALSLGYRCSKNLVSNNAAGKTYGFAISNLSASRFLEDVRDLSKTWPTCNLVHKQKNLEYIAGLSRRSGAKREPGFTKNIILESVSKQPKNLLQISMESGVCRRTVRYHLQNLLTDDKVFISSRSPKGAKLWQAK